MRPDRERPTEVAIGIYLLNISHVNEEDETLDVDGFIFLRWRDTLWRCAIQSGRRA